MSFRPCSPAALIAAALLPGVPAFAGEPGRTCEVTVTRGVTYHGADDDPDALRHQLDVYRPKEKGTYPVLLFLHGGGWMVAGKDDFFGLYGYGTIARCLAERGLVVVAANYRLSPAVRHPEHIKDVARAFAWTYAHCREYGGDRGRLFVGGHSAGGHLAALLATDEQYLRKVGRRGSDIAGVIGVSGVYRVDAFDLKWAGGDVRGLVRGKVHVQPLALVFGDDPDVIRDASPVNHVRKGLPPFLLLTGGWDYAPMRRMARDFTAALRGCGVPVEARELPRRTHETLLFDIPRLTVDAEAADAVVGFIQAQGTGGMTPPAPE